MKIDKSKVELVLAQKMMTVGELAKKYGTNGSGIHKFLTRPSVRPKTAGMIAAALGVPVAAIIKKEE